jgi:hypothetical protein
MRFSSLRWVGAPLLALVLGSAQAADGDFRIKEVKSAAETPPAELDPRTIAFSDHKGDELTDPATGLIRFEDWERARPLQKQVLSLFPAYIEPTYNVTLHGVTKPRKEKHQVYVVEARFVIAKPPGALNLARYATLPFIERMDPAIKHRVIAPADAGPNKDPELASNRNPARPWCDGPNTLCIESRYQLEGKLPLGIRLANKIEEGGKKIAEYLEFQSEVRYVPGAAADPALARLTGLSTPIAGVLEQTIFHVNQIMRFGKFVAVFQPHPSEPGKTVATAFMALGVKADVLDRKKEFERVPVLRNLTPAQVLMGKSSFNTGTSLSAGLPDYTRNRIKAIAAMIGKE